MALQLLHGDIDQLRREYMVLFTRGVSITRKLGFSDVIMPGRIPQTNITLTTTALRPTKWGRGTNSHGVVEK